jgi:hypothetical protein
VRIDVPDMNTVVLRQVPVRGEVFNKPMTNLLVKRPAPGMPFLTLVDENLTYVGDDPAVKTAFACVAGQQGWRPLALDAPAGGDLALVLQTALRILGFDNLPSPHSPPPEQSPARLLARFGKPVRAGADTPATIGREDEITEIVACLRRREPCMPLIVGAPGSGKTNLLHGVAHRLCELPGAESLIELDLLDVFSAAADAGRTRCFTELLAEAAQAHAVAVIEHAELVVEHIDWGPLLLSRALNEGVRIIGTSLPQACEPFHCPDLVRRIQVMELCELPLKSLIQIVANAGAAYPVEIHPTVAGACIKATQDLPGHFPGKALSLLDAAASFAAASGACVLAADDIYSAAQRLRPLPQPQQGG